MTEQRIYTDTPSISWGAVIGGTVTVLAISFLLSLLGAALGFGMVDARSDDPLSGVGAAFGISSAIALLVSLAAGGFVAGRLAGQTGFTHGFLTWAVALLAAMVLSVMAVSGTARLAASAIGTVVSTAGGVAGALGEAAGDAAGAVVETLDEDVIGAIDFGDAERRIREALGNSQIDALQPENLEAALEGAREDVATAFEALRADPGAFERIATELVAGLGERAEAIVEDIDRDEVVTALVNTGMTRPEAEQATDRAIAAYEDVRDTVQTQLAAAEETIADARQALAELEAEARRQADAAAAAASAASLWAFFAALVGGAVSAFAGLLGARSRDRFGFA